MSPLDFLIFLLLITALTAGVHTFRSLRRRQMLRQVARSLQMHFSPADRLRLGPRVVDGVPVPGSSDVRVIDLLFATRAHRHRYVFTLEYGVGVVRAKHRRFRVAGFEEPIAREAHAKEQLARAPGEPLCQLTFAPTNLPLADAYRYVNAALAGEAPGDAKDRSAEAKISPNK